MTDDKTGSGSAGDSRSDSDRSTSDAPPYDSQIQRARVRERVRHFTDEIADLWRGAVRGARGSLAEVTLDDFMKWTRLNEFRSSVFERAVGTHLAGFLAFSVIVTLATPAVLTFFVFSTGGPASLDSTVAGAAITAGASILLVVVGIIVWALSLGRREVAESNVMREMDNYLSSVRNLTADIRYRIGEQIRDESATVQDSGSKLKAVVYSDAAAEPVQDGAVDMMRSWRRLERLPYYLRHRWDLYYFGVSDHRDLPAHKLPRFLPALMLDVGFGIVVAMLLIGAVAMAAAIGVNTLPLMAIQSGDAAAGADLRAMPGLWLIAVLTTLLFFVYVWRSSLFLAGQTHKAGTSPHRFRIIYLLAPVMIGFSLICLVYFVSVLVFGDADPIVAALADAQPVSDGVSVLVRSVAVTGLVTALFLAVLARAGIRFAKKQGDLYKDTSDRAAAHVVMALQTHQKRDVVAQFKKSPKEFLALLDQEAEPSEDWNGWYEGYEADRHAALIEKGFSQGEASVEVATDPKIYVGEGNNRRLEVCKFDPTPRLLAVIPDIRRGGDT